MADITFTRGYGFPRGSGMDFAGYGGLLVNNPRRRFSGRQIPFTPEPGVFQTIPALDGFGTEYTFEEEEPITPGPVQGPEYRPDLLQPKSPSWLGLGAVAFGLWWLFGRRG